MLIALTGKSGVVFAVKLYPAGATTNSQDGVTDLFGKCLPVLEEMVEQNMPLLVISLSKLTVNLLLVHVFIWWLWIFFSHPLSCFCGCGEKVITPNIICPIYFFFELSIENMN